VKLSLDFFYAESAGVLINYSACFQICGLLLCNGETACLAPVRGTGVFSRPPELLTEIATATAIEKELMSALESVPEAFHYARPSSLVRGIRLDFGAVSRLPRPRINLNMRWFPVKPRISCDAIPWVAGGRANDSQSGWASRFYLWKM
jgi:hypothetical protein